MVAGDLVNTAARIQSTAEPGTVLVNDATRRASSAAIGYDDAGSTCAQGQVRDGAAVARAPGDRLARRSGEVRRARAAVRRPRPRDPPAQGALPQRRRRRRVEAAHRRRHRGDRQVAARVGVREVPRRARRGGLVAPRPLPRLRRRRRVLGARRDGPDARAHRRGRAGRRRAAEAGRDARRRRSPTRKSVRGSSLDSPTCWRSASRGRSSGRISSRPGGSSSSGSPTRGRWRSYSRTCSGQTRACSTSSSISSTGRARIRSSCSPDATGDRGAPARVGRVPAEARRRSRSTRSPTGRWAS